MRSGLSSLLLAALVAACTSTRPPADTNGTPDAGTTSNPDAGTTSNPDAGTTSNPDGGTTSTCERAPVQHADGWGCNSDDDCLNGLCYGTADGNEGPPYCTEPCDPSHDTCTTGMSCQLIGSAQAPNCAFASDFTGTLPGDASEAAGEPCEGDADCADHASCVHTTALDGSSLSFCAATCDPTGANTCGACGTCQDDGSGDGNCYPAGTNAVGQACTSALDCAQGTCIGFCTETCTQDSDCTGGSCVAVDESDSYCVPASQLATVPEGGACAYSFQCEAGFHCPSADDGTTATCTGPSSAGGDCSDDTDCLAGLHCDFDGECATPVALGGDCSDDTDCSAGMTCDDISSDFSACSMPCGTGCGADAACAATDLDTVLDVFASVQAANNGVSLAHNDDVDTDSGDYWSAIPSLTLEPGTYYVEVSTFYQTGNYELDISVPGETPVAFTELPENPVRDDDAADALALPAVAVAVQGTIDSYDDVDFYSFTLTTRTTVTITTGEGAPSVCLPTSLLGQTALGQACSYAGYCASGDCELGLGTGVCGQACTGDAGCPQGFVCADLGTRLSCVDATSAGQTPEGSECTYDYECAGGLCAAFRDDSLCSVTCDAGTPCDSGEECTTLQLLRGGQTTSVDACVPVGDGSTSFGGACQLLSDCEQGLVCTNGACTALCATDADCPGQNFPPAPVQGSVNCQPCGAGFDCGAGVCVAGLGDEIFCADECAQDSDCPGGFSCQYDDYSGDQFCFPDQGSCRRPVCATPAGASSGECTIPTAAYAEECAAASDCTTNDCAGGLCSMACTQDADCACSTGDLVCKQSQCLQGAWPDEVEPDDTLLTPQPLTGALPIRLFATLAPKDASTPDADYYAVTLTGGDTVDVVTRGVCGTAAPLLDTNVTLYSDGQAVAADDPNDYYGSLTYTVPTTDTYVVEVLDGDAANGYPVQTGEYVLEVKKH